MVVLDLKRLAVFQEVAERESFSAAADALCYTQPAVSHHVARLELEVGAKLITRRPRGPYLTPAGKVLSEYAREILDRVTEAESAVAEVVGRGSSVRLGAFPTASSTLVVNALVRLRAQAPEVRVSLIDGEMEDTLARLKAHEIDIAIVFDSGAYPLPDERDVSRVYLGYDPMLLALPAAHPIAEQPEIHLGELAGEDWIEGADIDTPASLLLMDVCQRAGFTPHVAFHSGNYQVVLRLVADGVGIALIPRLALDGQAPRDVVLRQVAGNSPYRRVAPATRETGFQSSGMKLALAELTAACERSLEPLPVA